MFRSKDTALKFEIHASIIQAFDERPPFMEIEWSDLTRLPTGVCVDDLTLLRLLLSNIPVALTSTKSHIEVDTKGMLRAIRLSLGAVCKFHITVGHSDGDGNRGKVKDTD